MKKAEIKELGSKELQERLDAAVAALRPVGDHPQHFAVWIVLLKINSRTQDDCAYENRVAPDGNLTKNNRATYLRWKVEI